jgi:hypothetical protein
MAIQNCVNVLDLGQLYAKGSYYKKWRRYDVWLENAFHVLYQWIIALNLADLECSFSVKGMLS